jgi:2-keto-4-pentenoate hydratase
MVSIPRLGQEIYQAELAARAIAPLSSRHAGLDPAAAYAIQAEYARLRTAAGATLIGRKIGATSEAIQQQLGVATPDYGHLFDDMVLPDGGEVPLGALVAPMVEPEIAFRLRTDLTGPGLTGVDVLAAASTVGPALEIIDSRITDWKITFVDTVADNGSSARAIFGTEQELLPGTDLSGEVVSLTEDGTEVARGPATAVLGHPATSVAWLANALAEFGATLRAGDLVLSGSLTRAVALRPGRQYTATFLRLGSVSCRAADDRH